MCQLALALGADLNTCLMDLDLGAFPWTGDFCWGTWCGCPPAAASSHPLSTPRVSRGAIEAMLSRQTSYLEFTTSSPGRRGIIGLADYRDKGFRAVLHQCHLVILRSAGVLSGLPNNSGAELDELNVDTG